HATRVLHVVLVHHTPPTGLSTLSLHDALPICARPRARNRTPLVAEKRPLPRRPLVPLPSRLPTRPMAGPDLRRPRVTAPSGSRRGTAGREAVQPRGSVRGARADHSRGGGDILSPQPPA